MHFLKRSSHPDGHLTFRNFIFSNSWILRNTKIQLTSKTYNVLCLVLLFFNHDSWIMNVSYMQLNQLVGENISFARLRFYRKANFRFSILSNYLKQKLLRCFVQNLRQQRERRQSGWYLLLWYLLFFTLLRTFGLHKCLCNRNGPCA